MMETDDQSIEDQEVIIKGEMAPLESDLGGDNASAIEDSQGSVHNNNGMSTSYENQNHRKWGCIGNTLSVSLRKMDL